MKAETQKNNFYQAVLEYASNPILVIDNQGKIKYQNAAQKEYHSVSKTKQEKHIQNYIGASSLIEFQHALDKSRSQPLQSVYQKVFLKKNDYSLTLSTIKISNLLEHPEVRGFILEVTATEHFSQPQNEQALYQHKAYLKTILDNAIQAFFLVDVQQNLIAWNNTAEKYFLHTIHKIPDVGENTSKLVPSKQQRAFQYLIQQSLKGIKISKEHSVFYEEGKKMWFELSYSPVKNQAGEIFSVMIAALNITERKKAEEQLKKSEKLYRTIAENYPKGNINLIDREYKLIFTGGMMYKESNIPFKNFLGKHIYEIFHPQDLNVFESNYQKAFEGETRVFECTFSTQEGYYLMYAIPLKEEGKKEIENILVVSTDISERKLYEDKLKELNDRLFQQNEELKQKQGKLLLVHNQMKLQQERLEDLLDQFKLLNEELLQKNTDLAVQEEEICTANEELLTQQEELQKVNERLVLQNKELAQHEKALQIANEQLLAQQEDMKVALQELSDRNFELDQIVYRTSHDIRSPLTSVLGLLNIMKLEGVPKNLQEYIMRIEKSILKLDKFVSSMLNFAKTNRTSRSPEEIDFQKIIDKIFDNLKYLPHFTEMKKNISIRGQAFRSDLLRIEVIFSNIISNAIKYQNFAREDSFLNIGIDIQTKNTLIVFSDNGIGIGKDYLEKVFDMFVRATDTSEGSGLGMYIVKQTIEKLNGQIQIESMLGEGTKIKISLPNQ